MSRRPSQRPNRRPKERRRFTVEVASIAAGGEGVGRLPDGRVVFVHRTAPGDVAEVELTEDRPRWARGRLHRVATPSPVRREAPCPYYASCGGCTLEHLQYPAQLEAKSRIVGDALTRIGKRPVSPPNVTASPSEFRYRNRVSFALRRQGSGQVVAGFHRLGAPDEIVDIDGTCLLPEESVAQAWDQLRAVWGRDARLLPSGEELRLTLRTNLAGAVSLLVEGGYGPGRPDELLAAADRLAAIWHSPGGAGAELVAGAPGLPETWGDETVELSGAAFLQVNREAARLLEDYVVEQAGQVAGQKVVDAYCGVGLHARRLARQGARVVGIELDPAAVAAAQQSGLPETVFLTGPVEQLLSEVLPADLLLLNPPRAGVAAEALEAIGLEPPARIIYISCNPATLARDLQRLGESFEIESLQSFDLFPQTAHVETVAVLRLVGNGEPPPGHTLPL